MMNESTAVSWLLTAVSAAAALGAALPAARTGGISVPGGPDGGSVLHGDVRGLVAITWRLTDLRLPPMKT